MILEDIFKRDNALPFPNQYVEQYATHKNTTMFKQVITNTSILDYTKLKIQDASCLWKMNETMNTMEGQF